MDCSRRVYLYDISVETGQFEIMKESIAGITADRGCRSCWLRFVLSVHRGAADLELPWRLPGIHDWAGFKPFHAAALNLIANTAPVAWSDRTRCTRWRR